MTRGVIFDMDGVLFDTERLAMEGWKRAGQALGYSIPPALMDRMRGRSVKDCRTLFEEFLGQEHPSVSYTHLDVYKRQEEHNAEPAP